MPEDIKQDSMIKDEVVMLINPEEDKEIQEMNEKYHKSLEKKEKLESLVIKQNNVPLDANETAQNNMTSVLAIANWQFNKNISTTLKLVANNPNTDDVAKAMLLGLSDIFSSLYNNIYKQKIFWKGADDKPHTVEAETIAEALLKAMKMKAKIIKETT